MSTGVARVSLGIARVSLGIDNVEGILVPESYPQAGELIFIRRGVVAWAGHRTLDYQ